MAKDLKWLGKRNMFLVLAWGGPELEAFQL